MEHSVFLVGGYHLDTDVCSVKVFELDLRNEKWIESCQIPRTCTVNCGASLANGEFYIFGGHDSISGQTSTSIDRFNFANKKWSEWASLPSMMFLNSVVFAEEDPSFYVSGDLIGTTSEIGMRRDSETLLRPSVDERLWKDQQGSKLWRISPGTRKFQEIPTKIPLMEAPVTLISGSSVFSCGGFGETGTASASSSVIHSPHSAPCTSKRTSALLVPRGSHGLIRCAANAHVYAVGGTWRLGGRRSFRSCEVYDTHRDQWFFTPKMTQPRRNFGLTSRGNQLIVFGGFDGEKGIFFDGEFHDVRTGSWRKGPDVPSLLWNYAIA